MKTDISSLPISLDARMRGSLLEECCRRVQQHPGSRADALAWGVQWLAGQGVTTSYKSLERTFYKFRKGGSLACIDRRKVYGKNTGRGVHQPRFRDFWLQLLMDCNRSGKTAFKKLKDKWFAGEMIPGYEKEWDRRALPVGWSYENLMKCGLPKTQLKIYQQGLAQAAHLLPQTLSTRADSYPLQFVFFDDVWIDRICRWGTEINRCFQLGALDFCTGMRLSASTKFRKAKKNGGHVYFTGDDMILCLANFLMNDGYNAEKGTTLVVENGTAAISPEVEAMLAALSGGKITVDRSGKVGMRQLLRGYGGLVKGNPRHKAPLESWHNLFHNRLCCGRDWAGKDRTPPETVASIIKAEERHLKNLADLPIERAACSLGHLPTFEELCNEIARVTGEINRRDDHALEGWQECGFISAEWTHDPASGMWSSMDAIADNAAMLAYVAALPETHRRLRKLSPLDAWNLSTAKLGNKPTKFTPVQVAQLLSLCKSENIRRRVHPSGGIIRWYNDSAWQDALEWRFESCYTTALGIEKEIAPGSNQKLFGVVNPMDPHHLFLFDENNVLLGVCNDRAPVRRGDIEAVRAAMGRKNERTANALRPLRQIMEPTEAEQLNQLEWNKRVADTLAPVSLPDMWQMADDKAALATAARRGAAIPAPVPLPLRSKPAAAMPSYLPEPDEAPGLADYAPSSFNPLI